MPAAAFNPIVFCLPLSAMFLPCHALAVQIHPLQITNTNPLTIIHAIPANKDARVSPGGETTVAIMRERSSHFSHENSNSETVIFDGETIRSVVTIRHGFEYFDAALILPYIEHSGGKLDGFIERWHDFFNLPQGGRTNAPKNELQLLYTRNGDTKLNVSDASAGIGDVQLEFSWHVQGDGKNNAFNHSALRARVKIPTGDADYLHGSGGWGAALWVAQDFTTRFMRFDAQWYRSLGVMWLQKGEVMSDQQNSMAVFGGAGIGVKVSNKIVLQTQLDAHTPLYSGSEFTEVSGFGLQLSMGGNWQLTHTFDVDVAVVEDLNVHASPDVIFHLNLNSRFY